VIRMGIQADTDYELPFEDIAELPQELIEAMLQAEGKVVADAQRRVILNLFEQHTGRLADSIEVQAKMTRQGNGWYIRVYPYGVHHKYNSRIKVTAYKRSKHGRTYTVGGGVKTAGNNDVLFVLEFGAPARNISAKQPLRIANEQCADAAAEAAYNVYDQWLKTKGL
jgi:hypothetical protein